MSIRIPFELLKEDGETKILKKALTITEENRNDKKFSKGPKRYGNASPKTVQMYQLDEKKKWIYLPFKFTRSYFSQKERYSKYLKRREYPKLFLPEEGGKKGMFKGELRSYQVPVFKEASEMIKRERTATLALYPSFGKTFHFSSSGNNC